MANATEVADLKLKWQQARDREEALLEEWKKCADDSEAFEKAGKALSRATEDVEFALNDWLQAKKELRAEPTQEEEMDHEAYADWDY